MQRFGDPIVLTATGTVSPNGDSIPNLAALTNPYGLPMELLEVRFSLYPFDPVGNDFQVTGQNIGVKMDLGKISVVDAEVPLSAFGSYRDATDPIALSAANPIDLPNNLNTSAKDLVETYWWRLKYPLYIPGGTTLNCKFTSFGQLPFPTVVYVTYHCRVMPQNYKPKKLMVPWVTKYNSKVFTIVNTQPDQSDQSSELDLVNSFDVPVEVTKLVGVYSALHTELDISDDPFDTYVSENINLGQPYRSYVTIHSSQGDDIVFNNTSFEALFPAAWRVWDLPNGVTIDPGEWLKVYMFLPALNYDPTFNYVGSAYFSISMVGYRELGAPTFDKGGPAYGDAS